MYIKAKYRNAMCRHAMVNASIGKKIGKAIKKYIRLENNPQLTQRQKRRGRNKASTALFVLLGSVMTAPMAFAQDADVVFLVDGSGSIDSSDWEIQKAGIANAITDTQRFGNSTAVTVIQWSSTAQVEVGRTLLDSTASRNEVVAAINGMIQLGDGTTPSLGIDAAVVTLASESGVSSDQILCLSTDGVPSDDVLGSVGDAQAAGVSRLAVIGIEDPSRGFLADVARAEYGPAVFGGGTVTIARNAVDFANLIGSSCLNPAANLVALEVNQSIQTWNNDIALVAGKETVVRAFVETTDGSTFKSQGQLFGTRDGVALPGSPLAASNPGGGEVEISANVTERRGEREASFNFELPAEWTEGSVELSLQLPGGVNCSNALPSNTCGIDASFATPRDFTIRAFPVEYTDAAGVVVRPTTDDLREQVSRVDSMFPVATVNQVEGSVLEFNSQPTALEVGTRLKRMHFSECSALGSCIDTYFAAIVPGDALVVDGRAIYSLSDSSPGSVSAVTTQDESQLPGATGIFRNSLAHEIGRNLGLDNAVVRSVMSTGPQDPGKTEGLCGETAPANTEFFPDVNTITLSDGSTTEIPTLGPLDDLASEVWGFDSRYIKSEANLAVIDPRVTPALMSNCDVDTASQGRWISKDNYESLLTDQLLPPADGQPAVDVEAEWDAQLVNGIIDLDTQTVVFGPSDLLPSQILDFPSDGSAQLTVFNKNDEVLEQVNFEPVAIDTGAEEQELASFYFPIRLRDEPIGRIELDIDGTVIGEQVASDNTPTVDIDFPSGNVTLDTEEVTIRWTSADDDGDDLLTSVFYSADGVEWQSLGAQLTGSSLTVPRSQLAASQTGRLAVAVTDGLNASRAFSEFFIVDNNAPEIAITSPVSGEVFVGVQPVLLTASVSDRDEELSGDGVTWSTDLNDVIGTGQSLSLNASELIEGAHVVTASITDSSGLTSTSSVNIVIQRIAGTVVPPSNALAAPTASVYSTTAAEIFWPRADASESIVGYDIYRDGALVDTRDGTSYFDDTLMPGTVYEFYIVPVDAQDVRLAQSEAVTLETVADQFTPVSPSTDPTKPDNITGQMYSATAGEIFWTRADPSEAVVSYDIFRNDVLVASLDALSYFDDTLVVGDSYEYYIVAVNQSAERSEPSDRIRLMTTPRPVQ